MTWITHPFIQPELLESRTYQLTIAANALEGNTMVVLPTGLGKTAIALLTAASRLRNEGGRILVLAPTKPLVEQHYRYFSRLLRLPGTQAGDGIRMFTGEDPAEERGSGWASATICIATPQVVKNDLISGKYRMEDVSLLIIDECHRAVGNYAYVFLARRYLSTAGKPLILAMTASPGGQREKVEEVCENLGIGRIETRTESDPDVAPYIHDREIVVVPVDLPEELRAAAGDLRALIDSRVETLRSLGYRMPDAKALSMRELTALNAQVQERIQARDPSGYAGASLYAELMKLRHALSLAEGQGSTILALYLEKLVAEGTGGGGSKASRRLAQDPRFVGLLSRAARWKGELHPKLPALIECVAEAIRDPGVRVIVFASLRDTVQRIVDEFSRNGIAAERFIGQATKDQDRGLSQKKQVEALARFRNGDFRVLVATSVGEEGIDVPSTDLVVFYEPVPSEIRSIQRKGRTGRSRAGRIVVFVTRGTSDETFRYVSAARERAMQSGIRQMGGQRTLPTAEPPQSTIDRFSSGLPLIRVDDRETSSRVVELLSDTGARISLERLPFGDYAIGDRIVIERKTARDFVDSLVDRDLLAQVKVLAESATRPVLIIEGEDLYAQRDINPNALRGALVAIGIDLGVTTLYTRDETETAQLIAILARREEGKPGERRAPARKGHQSVKGQQEAIIASFPEIGMKNARLLLEHLGSVKGIVEAEEKDLRNVEGIGEKKARRIYEICRRPYG
jgi:ERCC4-related helicase/ERCC4-type nuclease